MALVEVHRDELKIERDPPLNLPEEVQHHIAVFAARHSDHDPVSRLDQVVFLAGLAQQAKELVFETAHVPSLRGTRPRPHG